MFDYVTKPFNPLSIESHRQRINNQKREDKKNETAD